MNDVAGQYAELHKDEKSRFAGKTSPFRGVHADVCRKVTITALEKTRESTYARFSAYVCIVHDRNKRCETGRLLQASSPFCAIRGQGC